MENYDAEFKEFLSDHIDLEVGQEDLNAETILKMFDVKKRKLNFRYVTVSLFHLAMLGMFFVLYVAKYNTEGSEGFLVGILMMWILLSFMATWHVVTYSKLTVQKELKVTQMQVSTLMEMFIKRLGEDQKK